MNTWLAVIALMAVIVPTTAQAEKAGDTSATIRQIQDQLALKALVDTFSVMADRKETQQLP